LLLLEVQRLQLLSLGLVGARRLQHLEAQLVVQLLLPLLLQLQSQQLEARDQLQQPPSRMARESYDSAALGAIGRWGAPQHHPCEAPPCCTKVYMYIYTYIYIYIYICMCVLCCKSKAVVTAELLFMRTHNHAVGCYLQHVC
jgi:hypothetical protein